MATEEDDIDIENVDGTDGTTSSSNDFDVSKLIPEQGNEWLLYDDQQLFGQSWSSYDNEGMDAESRATIERMLKEEKQYTNQKGSSGAPKSKPKKPSVTSSGVENAHIVKGQWTVEETAGFHQGMEIFGRRWSKIADHIGTRTTQQVKSYGHAYFRKMASISGKPVTKEDDKQTCQKASDTDTHSHLPKTFETGSTTCKSPKLPHRNATRAPRGRPRKNLNPTNESSKKDEAKSLSPKRKKIKSELGSPDKQANTLLPTDSSSVEEIRKIIGGSLSTVELQDDDLNIIEYKGDRAKVDNIIKEGEKVHLQDASGSEEDIDVDVGGDDDDVDFMATVTKDVESWRQGCLDGEDEKKDQTLREVEEDSGEHSDGGGVNKECSLDGNGELDSGMTDRSSKLEDEHLSSLRSKRNKLNEICFDNDAESETGIKSSDNFECNLSLSLGEVTEETSAISTETKTELSRVTKHGDIHVTQDTKLDEGDFELSPSQCAILGNEQDAKRGSGKRHDTKHSKGNFDSIQIQTEQLQEKSLEAAESEKEGSGEVQLESVDLESALTGISADVNDETSAEAEESEPDEAAINLEDIIPRATEELILEKNVILEGEKLANPEYFQADSAKTPHRYLVIRNRIVDCWKKCKPAYLGKTAIRPYLRGHGDVKCLSAVHAALEHMGAINYGIDNPFHVVVSTRRSSRSVENTPRPVILRPRRKRTCNSAEAKTEAAKLEESKALATKKSDKPARKRRAAYDPFKLIHCAEFNEANAAPYHVVISASALVIMDLHAHLATTEIIGLLGGDYNETTRELEIKQAKPCKSLSTGMQCEMDPVSQTEASEAIMSTGSRVVGWYHSHPTFAPNPSVRDIETQSDFQAWFGPHVPYVGVICSPYLKGLQARRKQSVFNCLTISHELLENTNIRKPYKFCFDMKCDLDKNKNTLLESARELVTEYAAYSHRTEMLAWKWPHNPDRPYMEKVLTSIKSHLTSVTTFTTDTEPTESATNDTHEEILDAIRSHITLAFTDEKASDQGTNSGLIAANVLDRIASSESITADVLDQIPDQGTSSGSVAANILDRIPDQGTSSGSTNAMVLDRIPDLGTSSGSIAADIMDRIDDLESGDEEQLGSDGKQVPVISD